MTTDNMEGQSLAGFQVSFDAPSGDDFGDSPLLEFRGRGHGYEIKGGMSKGTPPRPWQRVVFKFIEVEAIQTKEDIYPFPTAELSIFYNDPTKQPKRREGQGISEWEALSESIRTIYGDAVAGALDDMFGGVAIGDGAQPVKSGKTMHWRRNPKLLRVGPNTSSDIEEWKTKWHDELVPAWQILEVEGVGSIMVESGAPGTDSGADLLNHILDLADGKTAEAFYTAALDDQQVMQNPSVVSSLTSRVFIGNMQAAGKLSQDPDGTLHKLPF